MTQIFNQKWSQERRRKLRNRPTKAERLLWFYLKGKQVLGVTFRRQYNIGGYIVDFYVPTLRLVVEVDGAYHDLPEVRQYDHDRTAYFTGLGLRVIRFANEAVFADIDNVLNRLRQELVFRMTPPLLKRGIKGASEPRRGDLPG